VFNVLCAGVCVQCAEDDDAGGRLVAWRWRLGGGPAAAEDAPPLGQEQNIQQSQVILAFFFLTP
jgi:hypothetical protein